MIIISSEYAFIVFNISSNYEYVMRKCNPQTPGGLANTSTIVDHDFFQSLRSNLSKGIDKFKSFSVIGVFIIDSKYNAHILG